MAGEYLPPVVTRLTAEIGDFLAKIAEAKAAVKDLVDETGTIHVHVDTAGFAAMRRDVADASADLMMQTHLLGEIRDSLASVGGEAHTVVVGMGDITAATEDATKATSRNRAGWGFWGLTAGQWLKVIHNLVMVFGAQVIADTFGIVAFGAAAVGALGPVFSNISDLGKAWDTFSGAQKVAADNTFRFMNSLQSHDVQVLAVYDSLLQTVSSHMYQAGGVTDQAAFAFMQFANQIKSSLGSPEWRRLIGGSSGVIGQDLTALFTTITQLGNAVVSLAHNFNFLGLWALSGFGMVLRGLTWLNNVNPGLARLAFLTLSAYHAFTYLKNSALVSWFQSLGSSIKSTWAASEKWAATLGGSRISSFLQLFTGLGIATLGVAGGVAILVGGLALLGSMLNHVVNPAQAMIDRMTTADHAVGTNIAGYQKLARQLPVVQNHMLATGKAFVTLGRAGMDTSASYRAVSDAQQHAAQTASNLTANFGYLEHNFGLTRTQAYQVAKALGLVGNLGKAVFTPAQRQAIANYVAAMKASQNPLIAMKFDMQQAANSALGLESQVQGLTNAFDLLAGPFATVISDTVTWKDDNLALAKAVRSAHGEVGYATAAQRRAASALATSLNDTIHLSQATLQSTHSYAKAQGVIEREIGVLEALHSKSVLVRRAIAILQSQLDALHSKSITIGVNVVASGGVPQIGRGQLNSFLPPHAKGATQIPAVHAIGNVFVTTAAAAPPPPVIENAIYLDGKEIYRAVQRHAVRRQKATGNNGLQRLTR